MRSLRRGFTLLEIVVALGILALIGTLTFSAVAGALETRDVLEAEDEVNQAARVAMDRLRRDLGLAWLKTGTSTSGVVTFVTLFVGRNDNPDRIWFTSLSHHRLYRDARECDQTEITYWTEEDPRNSDALVLMRREAPRIDGEPEKDGTIHPVAYGVKGFDLRYLDGKTAEWKEEWDSTGTEFPNELPRSVQITLTLLAPDPDDVDEKIERTYFSTVLLSFAKAMTRQDNSGDDG